MNSATWISQEEAAAIAPGLSASRLGGLRRAARYESVNVPPARILSDGEVIYDELPFRRWLESTVSREWMYGHFGAERTPSPERAYSYQDADLPELRGRRYVTEDDALTIVSDLPLWRLRDLRRKGLGPRFLKPTPRTVIYIAEEVLDWSIGVPDYSDPMTHGIVRQGPCAPPRRIDGLGRRKDTRLCLEDPPPK